MTLLLDVALKKPPTVEVVPSVDDWSAGDEAVVIAELAGLELDDWQRYVLRSALGRRGGKFAAFEIGLIVGRQNGKSEVLIAVILWALFTELENPRLTIFAAHEYKTAREVFHRLRQLLDPPPDADPLMFADPSLVSRVKTIRTANGEESVELHDGRRVRFLARTSGSGRGFTGDIVLLDEAYKLTSDQISALLYTMGARPNPQLWYSSSGPFEDSEKQLEVMARARSDDPGRFAYFGWEAPDGTAVDDREWWERCTPSHPHRQPMETLENEFRADSEGFAREKLCMTVSSVERVIPADMWMAAQNPDAAPGDHVRLAVDVNETRSHYAVVAFDGEVAELVEHKPVYGLVERLVGLSDRYSSPVGVDVSGPAKSLVDELEDAGVEVEKFSGSDMAAACGLLYDRLAAAGQPDDEDAPLPLTVRRSPSFDAAVAGAARKPMDDAWRWSRSRSTEDISPLVALTVVQAMEANVEVQVMVV